MSMFPVPSNCSIIQVMKFWLLKISRISLMSAILIIIALVVRGFFASPVLAPVSDSAVLGVTDSEIPDNSSTFSLADFPAIDDSTVSAKSYLVFDQTSGAPLAVRSSNSPVPIASLTKLMTGYLVNKYGSLNDTFVIPEKSVFNVNPVLGLSKDEKVKVLDLFNSMLVGSANDAALSLAAYLEDKKQMPMAELMNAEAKALQMTDSHFSNALGFDSETNYSTAHDLKILLKAISTYKSFTEVDRLQSYSFTSETGKSYEVAATNKLLAGDSEIHAVKTGFTNEAQGAMITSIHHSSGNFIIIVLGSQNREQDTKTLKTEIIKTFYSNTTETSQN